MNRRGFSGGGEGSACVRLARESKSMIVLLDADDPCPCTSCSLGISSDIRIIAGSSGRLNASMS